MKKQRAKPVNITEFNALSDDAKKNLLMKICFCENWADAIIDDAPFTNREQLSQAISTHWYAIDESDLMQAISAHPRIGDIKVLKDKFAKQANKEQGQVVDAGEDVLGDLLLFNDKYYERFGFIFIICASGKSAQFMLDELKNRLGNSREEEMKNAAAEQEKISQLRLQQYIT